MNTVAVLGTGNSTRKNTAALLSDWADAHGVGNLVVPGSEETFSPAARHAADWAVSRKQPLTIIVDDTPGDLEDYEPDAAVVKNADPIKAAINQATHVFLAWDTEDEQTYADLAEVALKAGKKVFDLTDGLYPIALDDSEPADSESEGSDDVPVDVPAQREPEQPLVTVVSEPKEGKEFYTPEPEVVEPEPVAPKPAAKSRAAKNAEKTQPAYVEEFYAPADEAQALVTGTSEPLPQQVTNILNQTLDGAALLEDDAFLDALTTKVLARIARAIGQ